MVLSYREENDQVILTMSREDWHVVLMMIRACRGWKKATGLLDRISRNPHYTPYQVERSE